MVRVGWTPNFLGPVPKKSLRGLLLSTNTRHVLKVRKGAFNDVDGINSKKQHLQNRCGCHIGGGQKWLYIMDCALVICLVLLDSHYSGYIYVCSSADIRRCKAAAAKCQATASRMASVDGQMRVYIRIICFPAHCMGVINLFPHYNLSPLPWRYISAHEIYQRQPKRLPTCYCRYYQTHEDNASIYFR